MPDNITNANQVTQAPSGIYKPDTGMPSMNAIASDVDRLPPSGAETASRISSGESITDLINEVQSIQANAQAMIGDAKYDMSGYSPNNEFNADKAFNSFASKLSTPSLQSFNKPFVLGKESDYNRYKDSKNFQTFGYTPNLGSEQEYKYGRAMTWGDTIGNALAGGSHLAWNTFVEGWKGWGRMTEALFTWDSSKLMGSEEERYQMAKEQEALFNKYAIYDTETSKDSVWNRQFFGNMLQQSGFAVGAIAQFALESYLTAGLGKLVSGAGFLKGVEAAKTATGIPEKTTIIGRAVEGAKNLFRPKNVTTVDDLANSTRKVMNTVTNQPKVMNSIVEGLKNLTPTYRTVEEMIKLRKAGAGFAQLAYTGLGGVRRGLSEFNMARSESIFEAASTYTELKDRLVDEYVQKTGEQPTEKELERIKQKAEDASHDNFWVNVGVLSVMNRIQFDNMFKSFKQSRTLLGEEAENLAGKAFQVTGKVGGKQPPIVYEKGLFGGIGQIGKIAKDFGKKKAAWEASKMIGKGLMKFEGSEGAQELIQEASNKGLSDYYYDLYHGKKGYTGKLDAVLSNIQNPITDVQGMKTFLMGALTGRLIAPLTGGFAMAAQKFKESSKLKTDPNYKTEKQQVKEAVAMMNQLYQDPQWFKKEAIANTKIQNKAAETMDEALANNDKYVFNNTKDSALAKTVMSAIKLGMYDSLRDVVKEYGAQMSDEEFKQAFGVDPTQTNKKSVKALADEMVGNIEDYYNTYKVLKDKYADLIIPELYKNNSPEVYKTQQRLKSILDDTIELIATNSFKAKQVIKRANGLQTEIAQNENVGASSMQILTNLSSDQAIDDHIDVLEDYIKNAEKAVGPLTKEQSELLQEKKEELRLVKEWKESKPELLNEAKVDRSYAAYSALINLYNKRAKIFRTVSKEDVEDNFLKFTDYIKLNNDHQEYVDAMNFLANPKNLGLAVNAFGSAQVALAKRFFEEHKEELAQDTGEDLNKVPTHSVEKEEDGTYSVYGPDDIPVKMNIATEEEANAIKEELDKKLKEEFEKEQQKTAGQQPSEDQVADLQEKLKNLKVGDALLIDDKSATVKNIENNVDGTVGTIDIEYASTMPPGSVTTEDEIKSRQDKLYVNKEGKIISEKTGKEVTIGGITPKVTAEDILALIKNANTLEELDKILDYLETLENAKQFTDEETNKIVDSYSAREEEIKKEIESKKAKGPVTYISENSPEFINEYNSVLTQIAEQVNKDGVTSKDVEKAFKLLTPVLAKLDPTVRKAYNTRHLAERNKLMDELDKEAKANDIETLKKTITLLFSKDEFPIDKSVDDIFQILNAVLSPDLKQDAIEHFQKEYLKAVERKIAKLRTNVNSGTTSPVIEQLLKITVPFRTSVETTLENLNKQAEILGDKKKQENATFNINTDEQFTNPKHRSILRKYNGDVTKGQKVAIENFQKSGMLTDEDIDLYNPTTKHGASEIINLAVSRMLTLLIHKAAADHFSGKDSKALKDVLTQYLSDTLFDIKQVNGKETEVALPKEEIAAAVDGFLDKNEFPDLDALLSNLGIPKSENIISKELAQLISNYRKAVFGAIEAGNILSLLDSFNENQAKLSSEASEVDDSLILDKEMLKDSPIERALKFEKGKDVFSAFYDDLLETFKKLKETTSSTESLKLINDLINKHVNTSKLENKKLIQALMVYALQTNNLLNANDDSAKEMTIAEMKSALNVPTDSLTVQQITQLEEFAKNENLNEAVNKLESAEGYKYSIPSPRYQPELFILQAKFNSGRPKSPNDKRTIEDLTRKLQVVNDQTTVKAALQFVLNSEHATEFEKALAEKLLIAVNDTDVIKIDNKLDKAGEFDSETNEITINLDSAAYNEQKPDDPKMPVETIILHELMHGVIEKALQDPTSEYHKAIQNLYNAVKNQPGADTFYAYQSFLSDDEKLREFVTEAFTNPTFQYLLANTQYANTNTSVWDRLMQILSDILKAVGIDISNTALSEVLSLTNNLFGGKPGQPGQPGPAPTGPVSNIEIETLEYDDIQQVMEAVKNAKTSEELLSIAKNIELNKDKYIKNIYDSLLASINRKLISIKAAETTNILKGYKAVKINNQTYYYKIENGKVSVVKRSNYQIKNVKKAEILRQIASDILSSSKTRPRDILPKEVVNLIASVGGKKDDMGSYASGAMADDGTTIGEQKYPNALNVQIGFRFADSKEYMAFKRDFRKYQNNKLTWKELQDKYNTTAVKDFGELFSALGSTQAIDTLIKKGYIKLGGSVKLTLGDATYDTNVSFDELVSMYEDVVSGVEPNTTEYKDISNYINKQLSDFFGFKVSEDLQKEIEADIFGLYEDDDNPPPPPDDFDITSPTKLIITSDTANEVTTADPDVLDITKVNPAFNVTAVEPNGLRSASFVDGVVKNGEWVEKPSFTKYYYKVRNIINILSLASADQLADLHVTLDVDSADLRWDGSSEDVEWQNAIAEGKKGVIGYISDENGNPIVFSKDGKRVGVLDRNNMADKKGLDNGENQIVYFTTLSPQTSEHTLKNIDSGTLKQMFDARQKVMNGKPQISKLQRISQGRMNLKSVIERGYVHQRNSLRDKALAEGLAKDNSTLIIGEKGQLLVQVRGADGAVSQHALFQPNASKVKITTDQGEFSLFDYVVEMMKTYNEMEAAGDQAGLADIKRSLETFIFNIFYTDDRTVKFMNGFKSSSISVKEGNTWVKRNMPLITIENGVAVINPDTYKVLKNYLNNRKINIYKKFLTNEVPFNIPYITIKDGKKTISFQEKNFKDFLINNIGLSAYISEIPNDTDIIRYNSTIHFLNPKDLVGKIATPTVSEEQIVNNPDAVKDAVANDIKNTVVESGKKPKDPRQNKRFSLPKYQEIYQKKCK